MIQINLLRLTIIIICTLFIAIIQTQPIDTEINHQLLLLTSKEINTLKQNINGRTI